MRGRHYVLALGLAAAAWLALLGDKTPSVEKVEAVTRAPVPRSTGKAATARTDAIDVDKFSGKRSVLAIEPRDKLFSRAAAEERAGRLFHSPRWAPPAAAIAKPAPPAQVSAQVSAPPLPFTYLGKKLEDNKWEVYLASGEQTVIAQEQSVIGASYRVDAISPPTISLTYLPLGQIQTLNIGTSD